LRRKTAELTGAAGRLLAAPLRFVTAGRLMLLGVILILAYFYLRASAEAAMITER
jgi:hypothetical protein